MVRIACFDILASSMMLLIGGFGSDLGLRVVRMSDIRCKTHEPRYGAWAGSLIEPGASSLRLWQRSELQCDVL